MWPHQEPIVPGCWDVVLVRRPRDDAPHIERLHHARVVLLQDLARPQAVDLAPGAEGLGVLVAFPLIEVSIAPRPLFPVRWILQRRLIEPEALATELGVRGSGIGERCAPRTRAVARVPEVDDRYAIGERA